MGTSRARKFRRMTKDLTPEQAKLVLTALRALLAQEKGQRPLARRLGMAQASVSNLLAGKNSPKLATATLVAKAMGVPVWQLLGEPIERLAVTPERAPPNLRAALEMAALRISDRARESVLAAAARLPDLATSTWLAVLLDPSHAK